MQPIDIIINNFTRLQYLDILVREIKKRTEYPHRIIVVDNAYTQRTKNFIDKMQKDGLIDVAVFAERNHPLPQSLKRGFELVESEYFVMTVDDTIPPWTKPCWLTHLVYLIKNNPEFGAIALKYRYADSKKYFTNEAQRVDIGLDSDNVEHKYAIEELFQIQKTSDIKTVGFSKKNVGVYEFSRRMEEMLNKKMGRTTLESGLVALAWDDDNLGYLPEVKNRKQYYEKKKFRRIKIVACFMAHHDDEFIDRFLDNIGQFTDEFYINLNEPTPYTEKKCKEHPHTKKIIKTTNGKCWSQGVQRQNTIRMLDDVKPDIVIFPDSDELFCDNLMEVLEEFWDSHKKSCWFEMKYCWGDEDTVRLDGAFKKMAHVRAFKWQEGLTYWPYPGFACPREFIHEKRKKFLSKSPVKHLKLLKKENKYRYEKDKNINKRLQTYDKFDNNFGA